MKRLPIVLLLVFAVFSIALSTTMQKAKPRAAKHENSGAECHGWSYNGSTGPAYWSRLFPRDCSLTAQSPVNIISSTPRSSPAIEFTYGASRLAVNRVEYAPRVTYDPGSSITYGGRTYKLEQFHFHLPGEHKVSNGAYVMEMHLVHKTEDGLHSAAVGVLFRTEGPDNPEYKPIVDNLPPPGSDHGGTGPRIEAEKLLPANRAYYKYTGSLTTPCCSEPVLWLLLAEPVKISVDQLRKFQFSQGGRHNSRPVKREIRADT